MLGLLSPTSPASCVLDLIAAPNQRQGVKRHKRGGFDCNGCPGCNLLKRLERAPSCQRHGLSPQLSSALKRWHLSALCLSKTLPRKLIHLHLPRQACVSCDRTAKISTSKANQGCVTLGYMLVKLLALREKAIRWLVFKRSVGKSWDCD